MPPPRQTLHFNHYSIIATIVTIIMSTIIHPPPSFSTAIILHFHPHPTDVAMLHLHHSPLSLPFYYCNHCRHIMVEGGGYGGTWGNEGSVVVEWWMRQIVEVVVVGGGMLPMEVKGVVVRGVNGPD
ncbi:hypothetical protein Acr_07g0008310 [Actinidia rufa]|uniref:Uncharacterized protein n=1 Tax=Actinidia rufa TaxID=165716 RepID=A0A7J0EVY3_9ERIC|nr:hypothetical protein Acr_07g0008310 [Actinidia rufa]